MDENAVPASSKNKIVVGLVIAVTVALIGIVGFMLMSKPDLVSPLAEGEDVRVIFVTPEPSSDLATESAELASPSATPKTSATPRATPRVSPHVSPSATVSATPAT